MQRSARTGIGPNAQKQFSYTCERRRRRGELHDEIHFGSDRHSWLHAQRGGDGCGRQQRFQHGALTVRGECRVCAQAKAHVTIHSLGPVRSCTSGNGTAARLGVRSVRDSTPQLTVRPVWYQGDMESGRMVRPSAICRALQSRDVHRGAWHWPALSCTTTPRFRTPALAAAAPIHTFHLGLWFGSPAIAVKAGCPSTVTPFNGDHAAGIQVLSTRNFSNANGPLRRLAP